MKDFSKFELSKDYFQMKNRNVFPTFPNEVDTVFYCTTHKVKRKKNIKKNTQLYSINQNLIEMQEKDSFENIYDLNDYEKKIEIIDLNHAIESDLHDIWNSTYEIRQTLDAVIKLTKLKLQKKVIRLLDFPCRNFLWMKLYLQNRTDIDYTGMDIIESLTTKYMSLYNEKYNWKFTQHDIVNYPLESNYDLIFSRHLIRDLNTIDETLKAIYHLNLAGQFLLITNNPNIKNNYILDEFIPWRDQPQNLFLPPYNLSDPICEDNNNGKDLVFFKLPLTRSI